MKKLLALVLVLILILSSMIQAFAAPPQGKGKPPKDDGGGGETVIELEQNDTYTFQISVTHRDIFDDNYKWEISPENTITEGSSKIEPVKNKNRLTSNFTYDAAEVVTEESVVIRLVAGGRTIHTENMTFTVTGSTSYVAPTLELNTNNITVDYGDTIGVSVTAIVKEGSESYIYLPVENTNVTQVGNRFAYVAAEDYEASDSFTVRITDGTKTLIEIVTVTINTTNSTPSFQLNGADVESYSVAVDEDKSITFVSEAHDADSDTLTYHLVSNASNGNVVNNHDRSYTYTPDENYNGLDAFVIEVSDSMLTDTATVNITVNPINDAPTLTVTADFSLALGTTNNLEIVAYDVDGDDLDIFVTANTGNVENVSNAYIYTASAIGPDTINVEVSDNKPNGVVNDSIAVIVTELEETFTYVSIGDSIATGLYYEPGFLNLPSKKNAISYSEQLDATLSQLYTNYSSTDLAVTGYETWEVLAHIRTNGAVIAEADLITLCVGANDIMQAAYDDSIVKYSFTDIRWSGAAFIDTTPEGNEDNVYLSADDGRLDFETNWEDVIAEIHQMNSDVELLVLNLYNPFSVDDERDNSTVYPRLPPESKIYYQVDEYFTSEANDFRGLNYIINNTMTLYPEYASINYQVVDVYSTFNQEDADKNKFTNFYDGFSFNFNDPHPNQAGHNRMYQLLETALGL